MTKPNIPENKTIPIAESGNQGGIRMWPSEDWASRLYDLANWGLIVGLIIGVISTVVLVWMGNVKESYLKKGLAATNERAAHAEERAASVEAGNIQLRTDLSKQQERTAKAEKDLLEVQERLKPRHLSAAQQKELIAELKPFSGQGIDVFVLNDAGDEVGHISEQIVSVLKDSGWVVKVGNGSETGIARSGIVLTNLDNADAGSRKALSSLESALRSKGLGVNKPNATTFTGEGTTWRMGTNTTTTAPIQMVIARK